MHILFVGQGGWGKGGVSDWSLEGGIRQPGWKFSLTLALNPKPKKPACLGLLPSSDVHRYLLTKIGFLWVKEGPEIPMSLV